MYALNCYAWYAAALSLVLLSALATALHISILTRTCFGLCVAAAKQQHASPNPKSHMTAYRQQQHVDPLAGRQAEGEGVQQV